MANFHHFILSPIGFPVSRAKLVNEASKYNEEKHVVDGWIPGFKWYTGFMNRHADLSLRSPQTISRRKTEITEAVLRKWFVSVSYRFLQAMHII